LYKSVRPPLSPVVFTALATTTAVSTVLSIVYIDRIWIYT
jgi:hypothetical protein